MIYEYLIFNAIVAAGPVALSFERTVRYVTKWRAAIIASVTAALPFLLWDLLVAGKHWQFSEDHTLASLGFLLPPGEILFFLTVPFACLFIWEVLRKREWALLKRTSLIYPIFYAIGAAGILFLIVTSRDYTALVLITIGVVALADRFSGAQLLTQKVTYTFLAIVTGLILVFNGYLTARPVVLYNPDVLSGLKIFTIPVEDFLYGYGLILLVTVIYTRTTHTNTTPNHGENQ
ncbi:MAG: lycopene cyclase domain-containing protein [Candidatus Marinimicrobia bacterium]|nr:lycopene cyclase domain-containing protein [Candidatus Neomarinimicrobiota bacterium]MCF7828591.1 lycopene cyclase domain-containing protein [Candidatus Neomarinimicrobiota bacterium]MCF7880332.1 lycopene cyclase domain-containing protein [Candidatus Neomarinimicrobiota bacterium]